MQRKRNSLDGGKTLTIVVLTMLLILGCASAPAFAVETSFHRIDQPFTWEEDRPIVAVALAGGGARATANLGVLAALEEAEVPIDFLVGTSMGALIAVLYGSGLPLQQIVSLFDDVDLGSLFYLNMPFHRSLLGSDRFNYSLEAILPVKNLEDFPVPTALLSFDLNQGWRYVQTTGRVADAIAAPYALQGAFPGVVKDDMFLVDAGTQEASPAWAAKILGADVVITTTAFNDLAYTNYNAPVRAWSRIMNLVRSQLSRPIIDSYSDVVIDIDVGHYSFSDFDQGAKFAAIGYEMAWSQMPEIWGVLEQHNLAPRPVPRVLNPETESAIQDLQRNRLAYPAWILQPQLIIGQGESSFEPQLFPGNIWRTQLGLRAEKGLWDQQLLVDPLQRQLDLSLRRKQLTQEWDAVIELKADALQQDIWAAAAAQWTARRGILQLGAAWSSDQGIGPWLRAVWDADQLRFDGLLWAQGFGNESADFDVAGYGAVRLEQPLLLPWQFALQGSLDWGEYRYAPRLYRGLIPSWEPGKAPYLRWQTGAELIYSWNTESSIDFLNVAHFGGLDAFAFADAVGQRAADTSWLTGLGLHWELSLIGLKPSYFSTWLGWEWSTSEPRWGLQVELSF